MAVLKVFKSRIPFINYVTRVGSTCSFSEGRYETESPQEIAELTDLVQSKSNPHIYIDPTDFEVDTELKEKIAEAQRKAASEVIAEHEKNKGPQATPNLTQAGAQGLNPQGMSPAQLLNVTNSATLGGLTGQSNSK